MTTEQTQPSTTDDDLDSRHVCEECGEIVKGVVTGADGKWRCNDCDAAFVTRSNDLLSPVPAPSEPPLIRTTLVSMGNHLKLRRAGYSLHSLAAAFPPMAPDDFEVLKDSIERNGQRNPVIMWGSLLLDGAHRLLACLELEIEAKFEQWAGGTVQEARQYVLDQNLHRRHLTVGQRSFIASELASGQHGRRPEEWGRREARRSSCKFAT